MPNDGVLLQVLAAGPDVNIALVDQQDRLPPGGPLEHQPEVLLELLLVGPQLGALDHVKGSGQYQRRNCLQ